MRRMQTIEKVIGENTFYIRPFGAFAAANISGELAALLSPILAGIAPLFGGLDTGDGGSDAAANPLDMDIEEAMPAISSALSTISGDKVERTYPGSTNPSLDGKPVMVLAVKGENPDSVAYSFLNMAALVDTYKAKETGKDASTTIEISGYEVEVKVNISKEDGNVLELKGDGLYVPTPEKTDISGKADKVKSATSGNFAGLDENGNLTDSGKKADDFVAAEAGKRLMTDAEGTKLGKIAEEATKTEKSDTNGCVKINGVDTEVYKEPTDVIHGSIATDDEVTEMLNEVFTTTSV